MAALVLDSEALSILAHGTRTDLIPLRLALTNAARRGWPVRVPTVVLAEPYRSLALSAAVDAAISRYGIRPVTAGQAVARHAGRMLGRDNLDSCHLTDAVVVATAVRAGGGVVVTADVDDLRSLASGDPNVQIFPV